MEKPINSMEKLKKSMEKTSHLAPAMASVADLSCFPLFFKGFHIFFMITPGPPGPPAKKIGPWIKIRPPPRPPARGLS